MTGIEHLMTTAEASRLLRCDIRLVRQMADTGLVTCLYVGRKRRILSSSLQEFIHNHIGMDIREVVRKHTEKQSRATAENIYRYANESFDFHPLKGDAAERCISQ